MSRRFLLLPILLALASGCAGDPPPPATGDAPPAASPPAGGAAPGLAPITTHGGGAAAGGLEIAAPGAVFTLPEGWQRQQPRSRMRLAQAQIPGPVVTTAGVEYYLRAQDLAAALPTVRAVVN